MNKLDKQIQEEGILPDDLNDPLLEDVICPECNGIGEVMARQVGNNAYHKCVTCNGKGKTSPESAKEFIQERDNFYRTDWRG